VSVTLKDIAEELNISVNAVSRALRNMPDIGQDTTRLVHETAERMGYRKNLAASYLKTAKSMTLGIVIPDICNPVFSYIYKGIEGVCRERHYALMVGNSNENPEEEKTLIANMISHGVDGVFIVPCNASRTRYSQLRSAGIPFILLQRKSSRAQADLVQSNDFEGGYYAAEHLYRLGHRRFLLVFASMSTSSAKERYDGFFAYLSERGLGRDSIKIIECDASRANGYAVMRRELEEHPDIGGATAIFCFSDYIAHGVYSALSEAGLSVPGDVSVVGYDNNEYSGIIHPPLTTVDILPREIGTRAAGLMLELARKKSEKITEIIISPKLMVRESTRKI